VLQMMLPMLAELPLYLLTAATTHLVMSFAQTVMHYKLGHHPMGRQVLPQPHHLPSRLLFQGSSRLTDVPISENAGPSCRSSKVTSRSFSRMLSRISA